MDINIKTTDDVSINGVKMALYGFSGVGKTRLLATAPNPIIFSAERGMLSLKGSNVPYIEIESFEEIQEAFEWASGSAEANQYDSIGYDTLSETCEKLLGHIKPEHKDPRKAYMVLADKVSGLIRNIRDIKGKNVIFNCKMIRKDDEDSGTWWYEPMLPGRVLPFGLPYFVDEVLCMERKLKDDTEDEYISVLQTIADDKRTCKDRSGKLDHFEMPDEGDIPNLTKIIEKILDEPSGKKKPKALRK